MYGHYPAPVQESRTSTAPLSLATMRNHYVFSRCPLGVTAVQRPRPRVYPMPMLIPSPCPAPGVQSSGFSVYSWLRCAVHNRPAPGTSLFEEIPEPSRPEIFWSVPVRQVSVTHTRPGCLRPTQLRGRWETLHRPVMRSSFHVAPAASQGPSWYLLEHAQISKKTPEGHPQVLPTQGQMCAMWH